MSDAPDRDDEIPAFIRSMLDPYVDIDVSDPKPDKRRFAIEPTYIPPNFRLSDVQLQAVGRVTSTWAVLEHIIEITLTRLSLAPQFPTLALTNNLGIDNRIKALKTLISLQHERYRQQIVSGDLLNKLDKLTTQIAPLKNARNKVAHRVWIRRSGDLMTGRRPRAVTASADERAPTPKLSLKEVNALADQIQTLADKLFVAAQMIPEVDEASLGQSLSPSAHPPLPDCE